MDSKVLEQIGLTTNEAKTYLALLELGQSTTGAILTRSGLNSGKIYEILENLKQKGLVSETTVDRVRRFSAAPPEQLEEFLAQKKTALAKEEEIVKQLVPELSVLHKQNRQTKQIVTYTGFRGIMTAAEEALARTSRGQEILSLGISDMNAWSQVFWRKWEKLRATKRINARYILSQQGTIYKDLISEPDVQIRILPLNTPVGIDIYGTDTVLILHYQEPVSCTLIIDEHTATTLRSYFEVLWNAGKLPKAEKKYVKRKQYKPPWAVLLN